MAEEAGTTGATLTDGVTLTDGATLTVKVKWASTSLEVEVPAGGDVADLKRALEAATGVGAKRQKLLNLKQKGKPAGDEVKIAALKLPPAVMLMGTPDAAHASLAAAAESAPEVEDDFDAGVAPDARALADREENVAKLARRVASYKLEPMNPPRPGKKLLVLDIDYTLFDHRSTAERPEELMRPFLHEFLESAYADYDIIIWSATGMKWIEVKMKELGVLDEGRPYKLTLLVDAGAMVTLQTEKYGVFDCKPLGYIWQNFPGVYTPQNTIMFDDLSRNFAMNPQNGLKIAPFRKAHVSRATDDELVRLARYLQGIARLPDLSDLDHRRWERWLAEHGGGGGA